MQQKIRAQVLHAPGDMRMDTVDMPVMGPGEALVKIKSVGVCGSDVHYFRHGRIGPFVVNSPLILGHECSGEVVDVAADVDGLKAGDRVVMEPGVPCKSCWYCRNGRYTKCPNIRFMATPPRPRLSCRIHELAGRLYLQNARFHDLSARGPG